MKLKLEVVLAAASSATLARAQQSVPAPVTVPGPIYTSDQAVAAAGVSAPDHETAHVAIEVGCQGRMVAGLRPNPAAQGQNQNVAKSGPYKGLLSVEN